MNNWTPEIKGHSKNCVSRAGLHRRRSQYSPRSPNLIEIILSLKLCEVDSLDVLDVLRAVYRLRWKERPKRRLLRIQTMMLGDVDSLQPERTISSRSSPVVRANLLLRVKVEFTVKNAVWKELP